MAFGLSQFVTGTANNVSSVNVLFSSAITAGNSIVLSHAFFNSGSASFSTVLDPVNTAAYTGRVLSTMTSDTNVHLLFHDKLNISSGRAASTYRISFNYTGGTVTPGVCAMEWSGGPHTFGSTASANGTSTGPQAGALTASSTPVLFVNAATHNSVGTLFNSTVGAGGPQLWMTTVDPSNANQVLNMIYSLDSSLQQNPMHSMNTSTRWISGMALYLGLGSGGAAAVVNPWQMGLMGCQDKVY